MIRRRAIGRSIEEPLEGRPDQEAWEVVDTVFTSEGDRPKIYDEEAFTRNRG